MNFISRTMYNKPIEEYYSLKAQNEFLNMVKRKFSHISLEVTDIEIGDNWNHDLDIKFQFGKMEDPIAHNLGVTFNYMITVSRLGSGFRTAGERYLQGSCSIRNDMQAAHNGGDLINNWLYTKFDISSLEMLQGMEGKPEKEQMAKMLSDALKFMDGYLKILNENYDKILADHPELYETFPEVKDIFFI